jgi:glycosyltransferase involved in cell wall biosynthesis
MKPLILVPTYNTGRILPQTVAELLAHWPDVWVVVDGSRDGSAELLAPQVAEHPGLRVLSLPENRGKGAALLHGAEAATGEGFTHVLTVDADGQHPAALVPLFLKLASRYPQAALMGRPVFGPEAPQVRVQGRKLSNFMTHVETLAWGIPDSLFGMRLYPVDAFLQAFRATRWGRRFDYDAEIAVRLAWQGIPMLTVPVPVRYLTSAEGGVSQFRYLRDNALLSWMHFRLLCGSLLRLPGLLGQRLRGGNPLRVQRVPLEEVS